MKKTDIEQQSKDHAALPGSANAVPKNRSPEAERSLREAEQRNKAKAPLRLAKEVGGRGGEEPVRYGDWEIKGLASDF